jgi:PAS domain S-box-containing protein
MVRTADGDERLGQTTFLWVESTQQKPGYLLTIRDITDKRIIERKLYAAENRYQTMYENSPAIIMGVDLSGNFIFTNPAMEEQSGFSEKELKTMHFSQIVAPEGSGADAAAMLSQRTDGANTQEMHYRAKNGEWKSMTLSTFPLHNDKSEVVGLGGVGIDISETKRLNEMLIQTQRMELLGQLAGGLAHDFRNMLTVISGYTKLIERLTADEKIKSFVSNIDIATDRAATLTKNLLTFSRGEEVRNEVFTVNDIVNEVAKLLPPVLGRVCKLAVEMPDRKFRLKGDPGKIHQCLLNLSINARDAMKDKGGEGMLLTLRVKESPDPAWFFIEVNDTGPGIPPSIIERIFDPFFTTKKKGEGTGLGLSVVYGIVKSHGGVITVDSRPSKGACFIIKLPAAETAAPAKGRTVCVVDNDIVMRSTCVEILASRNYNVMQFNAMPEFSEWYDKNRRPASTERVIALISAQHFSIAEKVVATVKELTTVWICKQNETLPGDPKLVLRQPFPAAALIKTVEAVEMKLTGVGG